MVLMAPLDEEGWEIYQVKEMASFIGTGSSNWFGSGLQDLWNGITQWGGKSYWDRAGVHFGNINLDEEDRKTIRLPKVETNYRSDNIKAGKLKYSSGSNL